MDKLPEVKPELASMRPEPIKVSVPKTKHLKSKPSGMGFLDKVFFLVIILAIVYIGYLYFQDDVMKLLQMNPYVWGFVTHITEEIGERTLLGLFYASFFGSLFFIVLPIELIFLYYTLLGFSAPIVITITLIGYLMGLCLDYVFGFVVGARVVKFFIRSKFDKFHDMITKWGGVVVFFGNMIVFPIQPVSVVLGAAKYSFKKFFILSVLGLFVKLFTLVVASYYFGDYLRTLI